MIDKKKVVKGLECCKLGCDYGCPYADSEGDCTSNLASDALELLKEPEPKKRESRALLPCKCGCKRREHWYMWEGNNSKGVEFLKCMRCGFEVWGKNATDVIRKWNEAVKQDG